MEAGADILQVFEAMGGFISEDHFYDRAMPYLKRYAEGRISGSDVHCTFDETAFLSFRMCSLGNKARINQRKIRRF